MAFDSASVADDRALGLRTFAFAQHKAFLGSDKVVTAEVRHRHGAASRPSSRGWVVPVGNASKGFAGLLARFVRCQHPYPPQSQLSRPAGRISILDEPCTDARWLGPEREAR